MKRVVFSSKARADIVAIADFIAADNPSQARRFIAALQTRCAALALHPLQGRPASEIGEGARLLVFRSYVVLHRVVDDRVEIVRVLHGAQDRSLLAFDE